MRRLLTLLVVCGSVASAQIAWDNSGNSQLQGTYQFRHVTWVVGDDAGNLDRAAAVYGTIAFDGAGNYNLTGSVYDSDEQRVLPYNRTGTYSIAASGYGFLSNPVVSSARLYGLVANGIFIGSSTEDELTDLFVAAQRGASSPFSGRYRLAEFGFASEAIDAVRDSTFEWNVNDGSLGTIQAAGYIANRTTLVSQTLTNVGYTLNGPSGLITYGGTVGGSALLAGQRLFYVSADGSFVFGGSPAGFDFFAGVRVGSTVVPGLLSGLLYQAGVDLDASTLSGEGYGTLHTYYGSVNIANGTAIGHQRVLTGFDELAFDYSYSDLLAADMNNSYEDFLGFRNFVSEDGSVRIGFGQGDTLGLTIALRSPELSAAGVFLNPKGVVNAASSTPFTAGVSGGLFLSLYGRNLSTTTASDPTFPNTLGGVQVLVNDRPVPIYLVSPTLLSVVTPFSIDTDVVRIQVNNNGQTSNVVTAFVHDTTPGIFTVPPGGDGYAAALHTGDYSLVTPSNPARPGETIAVFLTGLGEVIPAVPVGTPGPINPLSTTAFQTAAYLDGDRAQVSFAGLAPTLVGLYQVNFTVPADTPSGDRYLEISSPDSYNSQALLPVAGTAGAVRAVKAKVRRRGHPERGQQTH